jgi:hypothetical protein
MQRPVSVAAAPSVPPAAPRDGSIALDALLLPTELRSGGQPVASHDVGTIRFVAMAQPRPKPQRGFGIGFQSMDPAWFRGRLSPELEPLLSIGSASRTSA